MMYTNLFKTVNEIAIALYASSTWLTTLIEGLLSSIRSADTAGTR